MMCYASRTGTKRNLDALRAAGWGLLISRAGVWRTEGFSRIVADNGAWSDFQKSRPFDDDKFEKFLEWLERCGTTPEWIVLPDIVAGGLESLSLSLRYSNRCLSVAPMVLIAVQDGMSTDDLDPHVGPSVGIFLGGSTEWKIATMAQWGRFCADRGVYYHVARVNSAKRIRMAAAAGADSIDGTSASRFAKSLRRLDLSLRQPDMLSPRRFGALS